MHRWLLTASLGLVLLSGCGRSAAGWLETGDQHLIDEQYPKAIAAFSEAIKLDPKNADAWYSRGMALEHSRQWALALADYRQALQLDPSHSEAHNNLAWVLSTCPEASLRNGEQALEHARKSRQGGSDWMFDDTLAAAHAELGQFDQAVNTQQIALDAATADEAEEEELAEIRARLKLYREKKPFRE